MRRLLQTIGWVALCGLWLAPVAGAQQYTLTLKSKVGVAQAYVTLVQVCEVAGASKDMFARLGRVYLGQCPGSYSREYIRFRLRQAGIQPVKYRFAGAELVLVSRTKAPPRTEQVERPVRQEHAPSWTAAQTRAAIERAVRAYLLKRLGKKPKQVSLLFENLDPESLRVSRRGATALEVLGKQGQLGPGLARVPVAFWQGSGRRYYRHLRVQIRFSRKVLVAVRDLAKGARLSSSDVALREIPLDHRLTGLLVELGKLNKWIVAREIRTGEPLSFRKLKPFEMVKNGDLVDVLLLGDGFTLKMKGKARRGGVLGARIPVMNLSSKKLLLAEVIGVRQVRLDVRRRKR